MKKTLLILTAVATLWSCQKEKKAENQQENQVEQKTEDAGKWHFNMAKTTLTWTAYKTPDKVGVDGSFDGIELTNSQTSDVPEKVLEGAEFTIDTEKVNTKNEERDAKIAKIFFGNLEGKTITGSFGTFKDGIVPVQIKMNGQEISKDFNYTIEENKITLTGTIDILADFQGQKGFDALHEACKQLHLDKTWTDVSVKIVTTLD